MAIIYIMSRNGTGVTSLPRVLRYPGFHNSHLRCSTAGTLPALSPGMSKSSRRSSRTRRQVVDRSATTDVVSQLECAIRNPHAAAIGALIGGLVPWFGRTLAHEEIPSTWTAGSRGLALTMIAVVLGCACFSGLSVYKFGKAAFGDARKALGFVLALEGVMLVSHGITSGVALGVLILINAVANGSVIALARDATRRQREATARGAATRARSRAGASAPAQSASAPTVPAGATTAPKSAPAHTARTPGHTGPVIVWRRPTFDGGAKVVSADRLLA
jgi:hypothetical protein